MKIHEMTFGDSGQQGRSSFFSSHNIFNITKFQRPYTWEDYQIYGVFQDIDYVLNTDKFVSWPSMLIQETDYPDMNLNKYELGDGQQRSTTVFLFLLAIWHKWKIDYRETEKTEEADFFNNIFYYGNDANKGILGRKRFGEIHTTIEFQTPSATEKIHNLIEIQSMTEKNVENLETSVGENSPSYQLYKGFLTIWKELRKRSYSEQELKEVANILLTKIIFPVTIYSKNDDMFRAFANTNSFGEPLTQSELVKAEFYGRVKSIDPRLANEIANYWNDEMDTWFASRKNSANDFDWFLTQEFYIFDNWKDLSTRRYDRDTIRQQQRSRWLKTKWQEYFDNKAEALDHDEYELKDFYSKTFENIKNHFKIAKMILQKTPSEVLSKNWEIQYTDSLFANLNMGIIFQLNDDMKEKDFIKTMKLLRRYYIYSSVVIKNKNPHQILFRSDSPLRTHRNDLTYERIEKFLSEVASDGREWHNKLNVIKILSNREYDNSYNPVLNKMFVYINNEKHVENEHENEQYNTIGLKNCSREHIIPQTNKELDNLTEIEREVYKSKISKLGNMLVITGSENSTIKNGSVASKIKIYENSSNTAWGSNWIDDFVSDYRKNPDDWDKFENNYKAIDKRSEKMAKFIASYLCAPNDGYIEIGSQKDNQMPAKITLDDKKGNKKTGTVIKKVVVEYLQEIVKDNKVRKILIDNCSAKSCFYYSYTDIPELSSVTLLSDNLYVRNYYLNFNKLRNVVNELRSSLLEYDTTLTVEYKEDDLKESEIVEITNNDFVLE